MNFERSFGIAQVNDKIDEIVKAVKPREETVETPYRIEEIIEPIDFEPEVEDEYETSEELESAVADAHHHKEFTREDLETFKAVF